MSDIDREKWNARYREGDHAGPEPTAFLLEIEAELPRSGRALDVAGGAGRHALWLLRRGLEVTLVDIAAEGLRLAREAAAAEGLAAHLHTLELDLPAEPLPAGPFDLVVCTYFLERALFPELVARLLPGGLLVFVHPTRTNLERHARPPAAFLLEDGELARLVAAEPRLEVVRHDEGWTAEGRHESRLLARLASFRRRASSSAAE